MVFKASLDKLAKWLTASITLVFAGIFAGNIYLFRTGEALVSSLACLLILSIYIGVYLFRITAFEITAENLVIHRPAKNKIIPRKAIARAGLVEKGALKWTIRTFGNGGLFGYYGKFLNSRIGSMTWYATSRSNAILMQTKEGENIIITPDDPEGFLQALKE